MSSRRAENGTFVEIGLKRLISNPMKDSDLVLDSENVKQVSTSCSLIPQRVVRLVLCSFPAPHLLAFFHFLYFLWDPLGRTTLRVC